VTDMHLDMSSTNDGFGANTIGKSGKEHSDKPAPIISLSK